MIEKLDSWSRGSELKASHLQQPVDALNSLTPIVGAGGISVSQVKGAGTTIAFDGRAGFVERFQAIVMSQGPNGEADYTDARYWVQRAFVDTDTDIDGAIDFDVEGGTYYAADHTFTATNLAELRAGTHLLPTMTDHVVTVFSLQDRQNPPVKHYYIVEPIPPSEFWAEITDATEASDHRYHYAWKEKVRTASGWEDKTNGRSGTTSVDYALNSCEANNGSTGTMGNSIDHENNYPTQSDWFRRVTGNPVVRMYVDYVDGTGPVYSFQYENAEQGPCDPPPEPEE